LRRSSVLAISYMATAFARDQLRLNTRARQPMFSLALASPEKRTTG
jgi:hypothetical protein